MSKAKLIFDLILYVNAKRAFTAQDVAYEFNISLRTAHRYLMELGEMGIPIYTEQGRNGGYRTLDIRTLPPVLFDENEIFAIFFAFQSLHFYGTLPFSINVDSVSRKIYATLPDDTKDKIDRLESVLLFWNQKRNFLIPHLNMIINASVNDHVVNIAYESKTGNKEREVKPIGLYSDNGFWYMPAYDLKKQTIRLFRVDRISSMEESEKVLKVDISLKEWLNTYVVKDPIRLLVRLTNEGIRQCKNVLWFEPDINISSDGNGIIDMEIDRSEVLFMADIFFRMGTDAFVVEPEDIVTLIKQRANILASQYQ